jgi:hypothetical protein
MQALCLLLLHGFGVVLPALEEKGYLMTTFSRLQRSIFGLIAAVLLAMTVVVALPTGEAKAATITSYKAKGYIFLREPGPFGLGHVGVGYEFRTYYSDGTYRATYVYGGVENPGGIYSVPAGSYNGGWFAEGSYDGMMRAMRAYGYTQYKFTASFFSTTTGREATAYGKASNFGGRGYLVAGNNCMNATYDVLYALGTPNLRAPSNVPDWSPRWWFWNGITTGWSSARAL